MEPSGSLPCAQQPAASPYAEPGESSQHLSTMFLQVTSKYYPPTQDYIFRVVSSLQASQTKFCMHSSSTCPAHLILLDLINSILFHRGTPLPLSYFLQPPITSYLLGSNILLTILLSDTHNLCETPSFICTQNNR
jgi:hypothetical protein